MNLDVKGKRVFASTGNRKFDSARPCVIFIHGSGLDHGFWESYARFFATLNYAVLCPDLPGHSGSEGPPIESIEELGEWLNDVVETIDAGNISIVGHSQGVLIALEFVSRHPERVRSVSLIASGLRISVNPALLEAAVEDPGQAAEMMTRWSFAAGGRPDRGSTAGDALAAASREGMHRYAPQALAADLRANDAYRNGRLASAKILRPVQVLVAGKDKMIPESASDELIEHLDQPEVHVFADSGHMIPLEAPDKCRALLERFICSNNPAG